MHAPRRANEEEQQLASMSGELSEAAPGPTPPTSARRDESGAAPDAPEPAAPTGEGDRGENEDTLLATEEGKVEVGPPRDSVSLSHAGVRVGGLIERSEGGAEALSPRKGERPVAFGPRSASLADVDVNSIIARLEEKILGAKENLLKDRQREKMETLMQNDDKGGLCSEGTVERYERELCSLRQSFEEVKELEKEMHRIVEEECTEEQSRADNSVGLLESKTTLLSALDCSWKSLVRQDVVESAKGPEKENPKLLEEHTSQADEEYEVVRTDIQPVSQRAESLKQSDAASSEEWHRKRTSIMEEYNAAQSRVSERIMLLEDWINMLEREAEGPTEGVVSVQDNVDDSKNVGRDATSLIEGNSGSTNAKPLSHDAKPSKKDAVEWTEDKVQEMKDASDDARSDDTKMLGFEEKGIVGKAKEGAIGAKGASLNAASTVTTRTKHVFGTAISKTKNTVSAATTFFKDKAAVAKDADARSYGDS